MHWLCSPGQPTSPLLSLFRGQRREELCQEGKETLSFHTQWYEHRCLFSWGRLRVPRGREPEVSPPGHPKRATGTIRQATFLMSVFLQQSLDCIKMDCLLASPTSLRFLRLGLCCIDNCISSSSQALSTLKLLNKSMNE